MSCFPDEGLLVEVNKYEPSSNLLFSISAVPPYPGLCRFPDGQDYKQWTADDSKALMRVSNCCQAHVEMQYVTDSSSTITIQIRSRCLPTSKICPRLREKSRFTILQLQLIMCQVIYAEQVAYNMNSFSQHHLSMGMNAVTLYLWCLTNLRRVWKHGNWSCSSILLLPISSMKFLMHTDQLVCS